jgi:hypothetical protein
MMLRAALAFVLAVAGFAYPDLSSAQVQRQFPKNALRGSIVVGEPPTVELNGRETRFAPGARIRNQANMIAMSGTLVGAKLLVHYTLDSMDQLNDVWILTPAEAAKRPWPTTPQQAEAWQFDATTQTWSRP